MRKVVLCADLRLEMPEANQRPAGPSVSLECPAKGHEHMLPVPGWARVAQTVPLPQHWREEGAETRAAGPDATSRCQHSIDHRGNAY